MSVSRMSETAMKGKTFKLPGYIKQFFLFITYAFTICQGLYLRISGCGLTITLKFLRFLRPVSMISGKIEGIKCKEPAIKYPTFIF